MRRKKAKDLITVEDFKFLVHRAIDEVIVRFGVKDTAFLPLLFSFLKEIPEKTDLGLRIAKTLDNEETDAELSTLLLKINCYVENHKTEVAGMEKLLGRKLV